MFKRPCIAVLLLSGFVLAGLSQAQMKKRVAVFSFEDKTDHTWNWWDGRAPGDGMADMLTTALVKSGKYTVVERKEINSLLDEQKLGQSGVVTEQSAAQVGKMLGVELAVVGSITEFGYSKKEQGIRVKGFGIGGKSQKATVAVDVRLINTTTSEILKAENVRKEESSGGLSVSTPDIAFNNESEFDNSIVGKATRAAIEDIVTLINENSENLPWAGKVILVKDNVVYFKPGSDGGVQVGDTYAVFAKGEDLIDPDTGLSLGSEEKKVGTVQVTGFAGEGSKVSKAVVKMGSGIQKGDTVRLNK
jgi:curli biogenesis system outer membrane secretion channel CsgG